VTTGEVGIALGGGGPVGVAWEIGAVVGLAEAASFSCQPRRRDRWDVGRSIVGTLIRQGRAPEDLIACSTALAPISPTSAASNGTGSKVRSARRS
jgi:hypothetical protein